MKKIEIEIPFELECKMNDAVRKEHANVNSFIITAIYYYINILENSGKNKVANEQTD